MTECFPPALRFVLDDNGALTDAPAEPLGLDVRKQPFARLKARLAAGLLGVNYDDLWRRERRRKATAWGGGVVAAAAAMAALALDQVRAISQERSQTLARAAVEQSRAGAHDAALRLAIVATKRDLFTAPADEAYDALAFAARRNRLISVVDGYEGAISEAVFSPDGRLIATSAYDEPVRLADARTGAVVREFGGEIGDRYGGSSPDSAMVATTHADPLLRVWNVETGEQRHRFSTRAQRFDGARFHPSQPLLLSWDDSGAVRAWNLETDEEHAVYRGHTRPILDARFSHDGALVVTGSVDNTARVHRIADAEEVAVFGPLEGWASKVIFTPDDAGVVTRSDDTVRLWNLESGGERVRLEHGNDIDSIAISPDGGGILTTSFGGPVRISDVSDGRERVRLVGHTGWTASGVFSPNGAVAATASRDASVRLWLTMTGEELARLEAHEDGVHIVAFSPDGGRVLSASRDGTVRVWDARGAPKIVTFEDANGGPLSIEAYFPQRDIVFAKAPSGSRTRGHFIADAETGDILSETFSSDMALVAPPAVSGDQTLFAAPRAIRSTDSGDVVAALQPDRPETPPPSHGSYVLDRAQSPSSLDGPRAVRLAITLDGQLAATARSDHTIDVWRVADGAITAVLRGHRGRIRDLAFTPDATRIVSASDDRSSIIWDVATGELLAELESSELVGVIRISPDGETIVTDGYQKVSAWSIVTGAQIWSSEQPAGKADVIVFSPDGAHVAVGVLGRRLLVYRLSDGELAWSAELQSAVSAIAFNEAGTLLAVGGYKDGLMIFQARSGLEFERTTDLGEYVKFVGFAPGGDLVAVPQRGAVRRWSLPWLSMLDQPMLLRARACADRLHATSGARRTVSSDDAAVEPVLRDRIGEDVCAF